MHNQYASKGLVVVAVSLDQSLNLDEAKPEPLEKVKEKVLTFLTKKNATFINLLLDEPLSVWQEKLRFAGAPCVFVFDRQGKWTQFKSDDAEVDPHEVEKLVVKLLQEK